MKKVLYVIVGVIAILLVLSVTKDLLIKGGVEKGVQIVTGLKMNIQSLKVGIINTLVGIRGMRLHNPEGYNDPVMLDMPEVYVDYNLPDIIKGKIHLNEMRIDMKEFMVVKNEKGELNLDSLKVVKAEKAGKQPEQVKDEKAPGKAPEIQIDSFELKIGKVVFKDYSRGGAPTVKEFNVDLDEKYENITDPYSLVSLIVVKALMNTTIANLVNFDLKGLQSTVSESLASAQKAAEEISQQAAQMAEEASRQTEETVQQTQEALQQKSEEVSEAFEKATEGIKDVFKNPFGE